MDVERTMQFILDQQAQFASDIQVIKETIKDVVKAQQQLQQQQQQIHSVMLDLATSQERTNEIVAALAGRVVDLSNLVERHISSHS